MPCEKVLSYLIKTSIKPTPSLYVSLKIVMKQLFISTDFKKQKANSVLHESSYF
jgi:hypothetical protein